MKIYCPCCDYLSIEEEWDICPICFWEYDPLTSSGKLVNIAIGANSVSLNNARKNYLLFGACEEKFIGYVRKPLSNE